MSDAFFERPENRIRAQGSQLALIDGDHSLANALRNFENLEALAAPNSIIAIHDVVPMTWMPEPQRQRPRQRSIPATWRLMKMLTEGRLADSEWWVEVRTIPTQLYAAPHESTSLIGRLGSSAFRLSTTAASASLAGSCFSTESAHRPFHHGIRRRGGTIFRAALPSDRRQVQADSRTHLIHRPARDTIPPLGGARVSSCRDWFYVALMPVRFPWSSGTLCRQPRCGA